MNDSREQLDRSRRESTERRGGERDQRRRPGRPRDGLGAADDRLERLDRIRGREATRRLKDFDPERARRLENAEIRTNPRGFDRRHPERLDRETERERRRARNEKDRDR